MITVFMNGTIEPSLSAFQNVFFHVIILLFIEFHPN